MQVNIYLPDELAERVRSSEGLNVSQICQAALRQELEMIDAMEVATSGLEKAAARLRKSHGEWEKEVKAQALELGVDFAVDFAEWDELVEIERDVLEGDQRYTHPAIEQYFEQVGVVPHFEHDMYSDPFYAPFLGAVVDTFGKIRKLM